MVTTALSSTMAGTAAASTINNKGNLGKLRIEDVATSADALKGHATGAVLQFWCAFTNGWGRELTRFATTKTVSHA